VLDEAVRRLPGKLRAVFVLCYLQGRTHQQAARELGWPAGTVATLLARARRLLRTHQFVLDLRSGKATQVQDQPLNGSRMGYCWSPDGKRIAHAWRLDQGPQVPGQRIESHLIVSDADGGNSVTVVSERGEFSGLITLANPDWR
jgi:hypothetical protein